MSDLFPVNVYNAFKMTIWFSCFGTFRFSVLSYIKGKFCSHVLVQAPLME